MLKPTRKRLDSSYRNPNRHDRRRWFLFAGRNLTIEEIAVQESVTPNIIQRSIDIVREYRYRFSNEQVSLAVNEQVIAAVPRIGEVFTEGLAANKFLPTRNGRYKEVPDVAMRLKTIDTIKSLQEMAQPRGPLIQNNTQFNQNNVNAPGYQLGMSFESRLRAIREKRGLKNEEDAVILDAAEVDDDQTLSEEMEGIGIDMDEEDDVEDGEVLEGDDNGSVEA